MISYVTFLYRVHPSFSHHGESAKIRFFNVPTKQEKLPVGDAWNNPDLLIFFDCGVQK